MRGRDLEAYAQSYAAYLHLMPDGPTRLDAAPRIVLDAELGMLAAGMTPWLMDAAEVSLHLQACDLLLQPYPEGITARRTTAMAGLAHGVPMVSSSGPLTEDFWADSGAVALASRGNCEIVLAAERLLAGSAGIVAEHAACPNHLCLVSPGDDGAGFEHPVR